MNVICIRVLFTKCFVFRRFVYAAFAVSRIVGWAAHRIEEILTGGRIIRPAYKAVAKTRDYVPIENR